VIIIIYFIIRLSSRYILPVIIQKEVKNIKQKMEDQYREQQHKGRHEGDVTIEQNKNTRKSDSSGVGEYVDFEEVD
ncbi:MAG: DUF4834 domain-containing protein, partial [Prolixibacteraceae bacterium]|nr:DUF4834 domain-containing protein [Prolixibacteraceae bacterium]